MKTTLPAVIFLAISGVILSTGCAGKSNAHMSTQSMYLTPILVLPSSGTDELARETSIPSIASSGWITSRNQAILGGDPPAIQATLLAERQMRDTQRITSGRPYDSLRYTVRVRTVLPR